MTRLGRFALQVGFLCSLAMPSMAVINMNGTYQLSVVITSATDPPDNCSYFGTVEVQQTGTTVTTVSPALLTLTSGSCDPTATIGINATLSGNTLTGTFTPPGSPFIATVSNDGNNVNGSFDTGDPDSQGAFSARRPATAPSMSHWNLAGVALLLGWAGLRRLRRV